MNNQILNLALLHGAVANFDRQRFVIKGTLFVCDDLIFIELDEDNATRLAVHDKNLMGRLLDSVPCYMGGEYLYRDPVQLLGTLRKIENDIEIEFIESGLLSREGKDFTF